MAGDLAIFGLPGPCAPPPPPADAVQVAVPVRLLVACELFLLFVSVLPSGLFTNGPSESVESLLFIITLMRLMGSAASWRALIEFPRPGGQFIPALWEEEEDDDDEKATDAAVEVSEEWKLLPEVPEFAMQFFFKEEEDDEGEDSAPYFRELFLRFFVEPRLIALLLLTLTPLVSLLLLLLLALELASEAGEGSLTQKCLGPVRDLMDLFEPGAEGSEDECAEGIWGEDEDTCLDEPPPL